MTQTPNEIISAVRSKLASDPVLSKQVSAAWAALIDQVEARALKRRPKPRSFEVHHEAETARLAFFTAIVDGKTVPEAEAAAATSINL